MCGFLQIPVRSILKRCVLQGQIIAVQSKHSRRKKPFRHILGTLILLLFLLLFACIIHIILFYSLFELDQFNPRNRCTRGY